MSTTIAAEPVSWPSAPAAAAWGKQSVPTRVGLALAADPEHISTARRQVAAHLRCWDLDHLVDDATLITSELVTNAVLYGLAETIMVHLAKCGTATDPQLLITVTDECPAEAMPEVASPASSDEHGRGLYILQCLASRWGTATGHGGKLVWATLAVDAPEHEPETGAA
ncbi:MULTISPECIES: ATP-binding protein [unclassified Streptomyces]|uniref:ATP-binding protein n=1 Tax=unclassified Streptomyces TaxID=2593676 RepID=UPI000689F453|nr:MULTISPECIES: ATP-binding protein [unclassified Streptomyces]